MRWETCGLQDGGVWRNPRRTQSYCHFGSRAQGPGRLDTLSDPASASLNSSKSLIGSLLQESFPIGPRVAFEGLILPFHISVPASAVTSVRHGWTGSPRGLRRWPA